MAELTVKVVKLLKNIFPEKEEGLLLGILKANCLYYSTSEELVSKCVELVLEGEEAAERRLKNLADDIHQGSSAETGSSRTQSYLKHTYRDVGRMREEENVAPVACLSDVSNTDSLVDVSQSPKSSSSFGISKLSIDHLDGEGNKLLQEDGGKRERMNQWLNTCEKKNEAAESGGEKVDEDKSDTSTEKQFYLDPDDLCDSDSDLEVISLESPGGLSPGSEESASDSKEEASDLHLDDKSLSKELLHKESIVPCSGSVIEVYDSDTATLRASLDTNDCLSDSSREKEESSSDLGMNTSSPGGADISDNVIHISDTPLRGEKESEDVDEDEDVISIIDTSLKDSDTSDSAPSKDVDDVDDVESTPVTPGKGKSLIDLSDIVKLESPSRRARSVHIIVPPRATASPSHDQLDLNHSGDVSHSVTENRSEHSLSTTKTVSFIDSPGNLKNKVTFCVSNHKILPHSKKKSLSPHEIHHLRAKQKYSGNSGKSEYVFPCHLSPVISSDNGGSDTRPVQSFDISSSSSKSASHQAHTAKPLSKGILKKRKHARIDKNQLNEQLRKLREKSSNSFHSLFSYSDDMKDVIKKTKLHVTDSGRSPYVTDKAKQDHFTKLSQLLATRKWIESLSNVPPPATHNQEVLKTTYSQGLTSKSADGHKTSLRTPASAVDRRERPSVHVTRPPVFQGSIPCPAPHQALVEDDLNQIVTIFPDVDKTWARKRLQKLKIERPSDFLNQMCLLMSDSGYERENTGELNKGKGKHRSVNVKGSMDRIRTSQRYVDVLSAIGEEAYKIKHQGRKRPSVESMDISDVPTKVPVREEEVDYLPDIPDLMQDQEPHQQGQGQVHKPQGQGQVLEPQGQGQDKEPQDCMLRLQCEGCSMLAETCSLSQCSEGHVLCRSCVEKCVKQVLAQDSQITISCLVGDCKNEIRLVDARKVLPQFVVDLLQERMDKQERSSISQMSGIVSCPDCGMCVLMGIFDKQFHCPNTDCMLACCRYCKRPWNEGSHSYCSPLLSVPSLENATQPPSHWDPLPQGFTEDYLKVVVSRESSEFEVIRDLFSRTMREFSITTLTRIQNPKLWQKYALTRSHILDETGAARLNEKHLFHGTKPGVVENICREGFDWRLCGQHGTAFGQGSYFATDAYYSHKFSSSQSAFQFNRPSKHPPFGFNQQGVPIWYSQKFPGHAPMSNTDILLVARVACGRYTQGRNAMRRPPADPDDPKQRPFNSVVNAVRNPSIFVTFDISQSYPEYVVEYSHRVFTDVPPNS